MDNSSIQEVLNTAMQIIDEFEIIQNECKITNDKYLSTLKELNDLKDNMNISKINNIPPVPKLDNASSRVIIQNAINNCKNK
jgi:hypothetical protein